MKWQFKKILILFLAAVATGALLFFVKFSYAAELNLGLSQVEQVIDLPTSDVRVVIAKIINVALGFLGIAVVLLILYGGFVWMTAGGDEKKIETAKKIITNAVIGLIIIVLSFAISSFVLSRLQEAVSPGGSGGGGWRRRSARRWIVCRSFCCQGRRNSSNRFGTAFKYNRAGAVFLRC